MPDYLTPEDVDRLLKLPDGKAARMARRGLLPALILPDKSIRFDSKRLQAFLEEASTRGHEAKHMSA